MGAPSGNRERTTHLTRAEEWGPRREAVGGAEPGAERR
jgi:hypothetical protein